MTADSTPAPYDGRRGAAALILAVAEGRNTDVDVILGSDDDRVVRIALMLAIWFVRVTRALDASPENFAEHELSRAREQEARQ